MESIPPLTPEPVSSLPQIDERRALIMSMQAMLDPAMLAVIAALHSGERSLPELAAALRLRPSLSHGPLGRLIFLELVSVRREGERLLCRLNHARLHELNGALQRLSSELFADAKRSALADGAAGFAEDERRTLRIYLRDEQLTAIPSQQRHLRVVLRWLAEQFAPERHYHEREVNALIKRYYPDCATLRRHLIDFRFMARAHDYYWRLEGEERV